MEPSDKVEWQCPRAGYRTGVVITPEIGEGVLIAVDDIGDEKPVVLVATKLVQPVGTAEEEKAKADKAAAKKAAKEKE